MTLPRVTWFVCTIGPNEPVVRPRPRVPCWISLGEPATMSASTARGELMALAQALGIRAPGTAVVQAREELTKWLAHNRSPLVLKTDESFGGRGVRIIHSAVEAAWRALRSPVLGPRHQTGYRRS